MENILSALSKKSELIPDEHDGSYELVRETVRALSTLNYDDIKVEDLNMLYFSTVGTFSRTFNHKEACINKSSLNDIEKQKLRETLKKIRAKAVNGDYNNHGKSDVIGMFGTGIGTLRVSEANSKKVIKLCIDIIDVEDDDIVINIVDIALKDYMKGLGIASISQILHCLKPFVFPIFNRGPDSSGLEVYRNLGFKLIKPTDTIYYIENTKRIKKFRDENFKFKNYRVFDTFFWTYKPPSPTPVEYLPLMQTDISLEKSNEKLIIETKYKKSAFSYNYDAKKLHSENLYQIFSYIKNVKAKDTSDSKAVGILLYPKTGDELNLEYSIQGHIFRIKTVNLNLHWKEIHERLLDIVNE